MNILGKVSQGQVLEQSVFQNLRGDHSLAYYSRDGANEIDFIVDGRYALEVKQTPSRREFSLLEKRAEMLNISESYIVCNRFSDNPRAILAVDL